MGLGDFLFGVACLLADQRPSQRRRRKAQKDMYQRENSWNLFTRTDVGTCFACNGKGYKDWECRACDGTGKHTFPAKLCHGCEGAGVRTYSAKPCFKCTATGLNGSAACISCNGTGVFKPEKRVECKRCHGIGEFRAATTVECNKCNGTGKFHPTCKKCGGAGHHKFR